MKGQSPIKFNKILGKEPSIGPIPANQLPFWFGIIILSYALTNGFLSLGLPSFFLVSTWLITSWWLLTGNNTNQFLNRWKSPPGSNWVIGYKFNIPLLSKNLKPFHERFIKKHGKRHRIKPIISQGQKPERFMAFENFLDLKAIVTLEKDDRQISALLLEKGKERYQLIFMFHLPGFHEILHNDEVETTLQALEEGLKFLPYGENLTFYIGCFSPNDPINKTLDYCPYQPIRVLLKNEQLKIKNLNKTGKRQVWEHYLFATYTTSKEDSKPDGFLTSLIQSSINFYQKFFSRFTGNEYLHNEKFFKTLLLRAYEQGYLPWETLLNTKMKLNCQPCTAQQIWQWCWNRFNQGQAPPIPHQLFLKETPTEISLQEKLTGKHINTVLIEGQNGEPSCPQHQGYRDNIYLPNRGHSPYCGVVTYQNPPEGWANARELLRHTWKLLSNEFVHDTECWVELTPANQFLIRDSLAKQAKQSEAASRRAIEKGTGRDIGAELTQNESFEAQARLYQGTKGIYCAPAFLLYRPNRRQLSIDCQIFCNSFGTATAVRERFTAWDIWLQTLPLTTRRLLFSGEHGGERRLIPDTTTIAGFLPLTIPRTLDHRGIEFLTTGGKPIYIDLFRQAKRALITGTSGSGKSVLAWRFCLDALSQQIPVIGIDASSGANSTFKTAIECLGSDGAYFDAIKGSLNLLEPPDLRHFDPDTQNARLDSWKESLRQALLTIGKGRLDDPTLETRLDALLKKAIALFLNDPEICERYNQAFIAGWQSPQWQQMPTLHDFKRYVTRARLNLLNSDPLTDAAINQFQTQVEGLINSKIGKAIAQPSTFPPDPIIKFFSLSDLTNPQDQQLMAVNVMAAVTRTALSHRRSLFLGDELAVLFKGVGFSEMVGELCARGRKDGISMLLISQDPDSIIHSAAGEQIVQNLTYRITGKITEAAANSFHKHFGYDRTLLAANTSDRFSLNPIELCSYWLIDSQKYFHQARFYPGEMILASVANNPAESEMRQRILAQYPQTPLKGLLEFSRQYIQTIQNAA